MNYLYEVTLTCRPVGPQHHNTLHDCYSLVVQDSPHTHSHHYTSLGDRYKCGWSYHSLLSIKTIQTQSEMSHIYNTHPMQRELTSNFRVVFY